MKSFLIKVSFSLLFIFPISTLTPLPASSEEPFCFECHDDFADDLKGFAFKHEPAAGGDCTECHEDHGDDEELKLVEKGSALCYQCHDAKDEGKTVHKPVSLGLCVFCHSPHGSANKRFLKAETNDLCMKCHAKNKQFAHDVTHDALDEGCLECHNPHNSQLPKLLAANLNLERKAVFEVEQAELCFNCHDQDTFLTRQSEDTGFRRGKQNLHYLHLTGNAKANKYGIVKKKGGQTCFACHLPHTATQEKLLRTEFECDDILCYVLRYTQRDDGGTCRVGCHKIQTYSREADLQETADNLSRSERTASSTIR